MQALFERIVTKSSFVAPVIAEAIMKQRTTKAVEDKLKSDLNVTKEISSPRNPPVLSIYQLNLRQEFQSETLVPQVLSPEGLRAPW